MIYLRPPIWRATLQKVLNKLVRAGSGSREIACLETALPKSPNPPRRTLYGATVMPEGVEQMTSKYADKGRYFRTL
jgi:hypothetical protein